MRSTRVARRYAQSLMEAAGDLRTLDATAADIEKISAVVNTSREFRRFLSSPIVSFARKEAVLREVFHDQISASTLSFLDLIVKKQRETLLPEILEQFGVLRDVQMGIVNVDVTTAVELTQPQLRGLQTELERHTGKNVRLKVMTDPAIRGGLVIQIGDTVLDASLTRQLERLRERFARGAALPQ